MPPAAALAIARFGILEAARTRLPWLVAAALALALAAGMFLEQLALAEAARIRVAAFAAGARLALVVILALHVLGSVAREFNDKGLELVLAADLPRWHYILGRLAGFIAVAWLLAIPATLVQLAQCPPAAALQWGLSLALELSIVAALALFCIVTFTHLVPAAGFVLGFYVLARSLAAMQLMGAAPIGSHGVLHRLLAGGVDALALVVPSLDRYASTGWLVDHAVSWASLAAQAGETLLYVAVLAAAATFDFYRREL